MSVLYNDVLLRDEMNRSVTATPDRDDRPDVRVVILPATESAIIGHAYREPLTAIHVVVDLLEATWEDAEWQ